MLRRPSQGTNIYCACNCVGELLNRDNRGRSRRFLPDRALNLLNQINWQAQPIIIQSAEQRGQVNII